VRDAGNKSNTAVCISGVPKYWESGLSSIEDFFPNADIFMHIWDIEGLDLSNSVNNDRKRFYNGKDFNIYNIIEAFNPTCVTVEKFSSYGHKWQQQLQSYVERNLNGSSGGTISFMSARYGMSEAFKLKNSYAERVGKKYDYSVRMRFDSNIVKLNVDALDKGKVNIPVKRNWSPVGINDQFAWGPDRLMRRFELCFDNIDAIVEATEAYYPEWNWAEFLKRINVNPDQLHRTTEARVLINDETLTSPEE
jgi:hypothetical protein